MEISERKKYVRIGHSVPLRDKIIYFSASFETPFLADGVSSRFFLSLYQGRRNVKNIGGYKTIKLAYLQIFYVFFFKFLHCLEAESYKKL